MCKVNETWPLWILNLEEALLWDLEQIKKRNQWRIITCSLKDQDIKKKKFVKANFVNLMPQLGVMVSKLVRLTISTSFDPHWGPSICDLFKWIPCHSLLVNSISAGELGRDPQIRSAAQIHELALTWRITNASHILYTRTLALHRRLTISAGRLGLRLPELSHQTTA